MGTVFAARSRQARARWRRAPYHIGKSSHYPGRQGPFAYTKPSPGGRTKNAALPPVVVGRAATLRGTMGSGARRGPNAQTPRGAMGERAYNWLKSTTTRNDCPLIASSNASLTCVAG